ncbi:uncharacterized protein LOC135361232 [Latimeria chalumnae]|uniref:uncharacterized protein LOC135361232 n=1 Tax=Latimeria chalumnae TaxID=7897 RepID=UPI00313CE8DC
MITIPNSNLEAGDRIQVRVEHDSTESPVTKEVTFSKDEKLGMSEMYAVSDIFMPEVVQANKEVTLMCSFGGIIPKDSEAKWIRKGSEDIEITEQLNSPGLTFTPTVTGHAEFTCELKHHSFRAAVKSELKTCTVVAKPEISNIKQLPGTEKSNVKFAAEITSFFPAQIKTHWHLNGKQIQSHLEPLHHNGNKTDSTSSVITIARKDLQAGGQIQFTVEHNSLESPMTEEMTVPDLSVDIKPESHNTDVSQRGKEVTDGGTQTAAPTGEKPNAAEPLGNKRSSFISLKKVLSLRRSVSQGDDHTPANVPAKTKEEIVSAVPEIPAESHSAAVSQTGTEGTEGGTQTVALTEFFKKEKEDILEISMPSPLFVGKEVRLTRSLKGSFPKV